MTDDASDAVRRPDERPILDIVVHRSPESGLYTAHVRSLHPMVVKAYALAEVFKSIWDALAVQDALGRFASNVVIECKYRFLREDNDSLQAEVSQFVRALGRIADLDHPHGPVTTMDEAREVASSAFDDARRAGRERRRAWRTGALAQTDASVDRDLLQALCAAVNGVLPLLAPGGAPEPDSVDPVSVAFSQLREVLAICGKKTLKVLPSTGLSGIVAADE